MRSRWIASIAVVMLCMGYVAGRAFTEDEGADAEADAMKQMMELGKPGPAQDLLKPLAGTFEGQAKMWMGPGEPQVSKARISNAWMLGGRFLRGMYWGTMNGKPFKGVSLFGHDNFKKTYQSVWMDSWSSNISMQTGEASEDGKTITMHGSWESPMGKFDTRYVYTIVSDDEWRLESWASQGGKNEFKEMEIDFHRVTDADCAK